MQKKLQRYLKRIKRLVDILSPSQKRMILFGVVLLIIGFLWGNAAGKSKMEAVWKGKIEVAVEQARQEEKKKTDAVEAELNDLQDEIALANEVKEVPWYLVLVNRDNPMQTGYIPKLVDLKPDYAVDVRIADAAKKMLADAKKEGLNVIICSAYRSVERQKQVFNESMQERMNKGMDYWSAYKDTSLSVLDPGTSEHALGLALDLISNQYTNLDKKQEETKEAKWLAANCHKYGFILRYPPNKTDITGIIYEPWHYRYVGVEDATKIMELGVTLEEYLEEYY